MHPRSWILLAAVVLAPPGTARSQPALSASATEVRSGGAVSFEWSGLPGGVEEVELEISLDGGAWRRLSPELEGHEARFEWRVPDGIAGSARVRLRFGGRHDESLGPEATLRIVSDAPDAPVAVRKLRDWWHLEEAAGVPAPGLVVPWQASLSPAHASAAVSRSTDEDVPLAACPARDALRRDLDAAPRALPPRSFVAPRSAPLRN